MKCIVVSVVVGFRYMSISKCMLFLLIVRLRKLMHPLDSGVGLNCRLACIVLVYCVRYSWSVVSVSDDEDVIYVSSVILYAFGFYEGCDVDVL